MRLKNPMLFVRFFLCSGGFLGCWQPIQAEISAFKFDSDTTKLKNMTDTTHLLAGCEVVGYNFFDVKIAEKSIVPIQIITPEMIAKSAARDLPELLQRRVGIQIQNDNILGASIGFQGISGENVKILVDNMPLTGRVNGNIDLSQLNLNNIQQIEIVEGPASVMYGTNALGGVINIITKNNLTEKKRRVSMRYYGETANHHNVSADASWILGGGHSLQIDGGRNAFLGWSPPDSLASRPRFTQWKPRIQYFLNGKYQFQANGFDLIANFSGFDEFLLNRGRPIAPYGERAFDDELVTRRFAQNISGGYRFSSKKQVKFFVSHNNFERTKSAFFKNLVNGERQLTQNDGDQDTSRFGLWNARGVFMGKNANNRLKFDLGYDINHETGEGKRLGGKTQSIGDYAGFGSLEWVARPAKNGDDTGGGQLSVMLGVRASYNTSYRPPITPSLNVKYDIRDNWTVRASYARGFRSPSLKELYFYFVDINHNIRGNENLKAETSHSFNASTFWRKVTDKNHIFRAEINGFHNDLTNQIELALVRAVDNGVPEYAYINIGRARTMGGRVDLNGRMGKFSTNLATNFLRKMTILPNQTFAANVWDMRGTVGFDWHKNHTLQLSVKHNARNQGFVLNENQTVSPIFVDAFSLVDLNWLGNFSVKKHEIQVNLGVKNVLDVQNVAAQLVGGGHTGGGGSTAIATGRTLFLSLKIQI